MDDTKLTRRSLLARMALGGGALVLPTSAWLACRPAPSAVAVSKERRTDRYFVFYYMMGGWDLTLLSDPLVPNGRISTQYQPSEIFEAGKHRFGPAMRPVAPWFDRMGIIRGIEAQALNHPQARFQLVSGHFKEPGEAVHASVQTRIARHIGKAYPLPNLSSDGIRPAVYLGDHDAHVKPLRIRSVDQLESLTRVDGDTRKYRADIEEVIAARDRAFVQRYQQALAKDFVTYAELARRVGDSDLAARAALAGKLALPSGLQHVQRGSRWAVQAELAVECIKHDLAPCVTVGSGEFDSHDRNEYVSHRQKVERGMETVAAICHGLEQHKLDDGSTLLDKTTVCVFSEFSREPWINELGGKHHWSANSVILIGNGVKRSAAGEGPVVFGETDDGLFPVPIDAETGSRTSRSAELMIITHGLATVLQIAGVDPAQHFDEPPITAVLA